MSKRKIQEILKIFSLMEFPFSNSARSKMGNMKKALVGMIPELKSYRRCRD
jgi:hypothetical protein